MTSRIPESPSQMEAEAIPDLDAGVEMEPAEEAAMHLEPEV